MFGLKKKSEEIIAGTAIIAIIFSSISLLFSLYYSDAIYPGEISTLEPVGIGIIRQTPDIWSQSDGIILPIEWYNSWRQKAEIIRQPYLILKENKSNKTFRFELAGEYPDLSGKSLDENWAIKQTFVLPPKVLSVHVLVFKTNRLFETRYNASIFRFKSGENYAVSLGFQRCLNGNFKSCNEIPLTTISIPEIIDDQTEWRLNRFYWIYFDFNKNSDDTQS